MTLAGADLESARLKGTRLDLAGPSPWRSGMAPSWTELRDDSAAAQPSRRVARSAFQPQVPSTPAMTTLTAIRNPWAMK